MERETTSFDPKTWIDPKPIPAGEAAETGENTADMPNIEGGGDESGGSGRTNPMWFGAPVGVLALAGLAWFFWPSSAPESTPDATASAAPSVQVTQAAEPTGNGSMRIIQVSGFQDLGTSLEAMGLSNQEAFSIAQEAIAALGTEGDMRVSVELSGSGQKLSVATLVAEMASGNTVKLTRQEDGTFSRETVLDAAKPRVRMASGTINQNTVYASVVEAGIPDSLATDFAKAFSFDFDFQRDVQIGDTFSAAWEETVTESGRSIAAPKLLYVKLTSAGKTRAYYAFTPPDETELRFFDESGQGNERGLMRTPVDGARITSKYGYRTHPISRRQKKHNGVDFAAPTGTPVYASGEATVLFRARAGGAGNLIKLDHGEGMQTWYMHLNRFADDLVQGGPVRQGQIIGYVGSTGASTGPHLHYEIRLNGVPTDPLTYETSEIEALEGAALRMFQTRRDATKAGKKSGS
ncbi:MAG: peptidoglycan DD-metalloendopeptidase family protein [Erythrobacter sp.]